MFGQNETNLIGRVGAEPVITTTNSGGRVVTFSVATDESYTNKNGERVQRTEWASGCDVHTRLGQSHCVLAEKGCFERQAGADSWQKPHALIPRAK